MNNGCERFKNWVHILYKHKIKQLRTFKKSNFSSSLVSSLKWGNFGTEEILGVFSQLLCTNSISFESIHINQIYHLLYTIHSE